MNKEAADVIKSIADKLDLPVEQLWSGLVAYAPYEFYDWLAWAILTFTLAVVALCACLWGAWKEGEGRSDFYGAIFCAGGIAFVLMGVLFLFSFAGIGNALAAKNAPQAWAAKYVITKIKK